MGSGITSAQLHRSFAETSDASLWEDYIQRLICSNDADLAHWLTSFLADGVQRPWSINPGSAVAMRGGAGGGKTFLGNALRRLVGPTHAQEISQSDRMFAQFNRGLFGSTFVLAEESLFAGSKAQAATAKSFITSDIWTYEQKYLASFSAKNVHRVIATTNEDQAVHIDHDDRRWTVIEVPTLFENAHGPGQMLFGSRITNLCANTPTLIAVSTSLNTAAATTRLSHFVTLSATEGTYSQSVGRQKARICLRWDTFTLEARPFLLEVAGSIRPKHAPLPRGLRNNAHLSNRCCQTNSN